MNAMKLINALGFIDDDLLFDAMEAPRQGTVKGGSGIKQPKPNKPNRGGAKVKAIVIGVVALICAAAITIGVLFATGVFGAKQTPIYKGMEISSTTSATASADSSATALSSRFGGDYKGKNDDVDKNNPYGGSGSLDSAVSSTLQVTGSGEDIYYADAGEDIYITVKFYNPDYYDIVSFVLYDGTTETHYTSYMFETGSDYENIIVKLNVGNTPGIINYTISEIKYLDDKVNRDVIVDGETVVSCGVRTSNMVTASVSGETTDLTSISLSVNLKDTYSLIAYSNDYYAKALLYDGETILQTVDLSSGTNNVTFTNLTPNTLYQYAIVGYYDDLSGSGASLNYLYTSAVYTDAVVLFDEVTVGQESISFAYSWYEGYSKQRITDATLTCGSTVQHISDNEFSVTGLLSDTDYILTAYYVGINGTTESITLEFTTEAKAVPTVEIEATSTKTTINYELTITDIDAIGSINSAALYLGDTRIKSITTLSGELTGLLSNNTYTVIVVYTYELNDGTGSQALIVSKDITTEPMAIPTVEIEVTDATVSTLTFTVDFIDIDNVGAIEMIELYNGDTRVKAETNLVAGEYTYEGLSSYTEYTLKVKYDYNLNDDMGYHTAEQTLAEYTYPSLTLNSVSCENTSAVIEGGTIYLTANVNNPNNVSYTSAVVNGVTYTDVSGSKGSTLNVDVVNDGQFEGGNTTLTITKITCTIDGKTYTIDITENNEVSAFIYGKFTVEDYTVVRYNSTTEQYEQTYYGFPDEQLYFKISLDNETGYTVDSVTIENTTYTSSSITMSDDKQAAYIPFDDSVITNSSNALTNITSLYSVSYSYGNVSKSTPVNISAYYVRLESSEVVEISTADDLMKNLDGKKYYKLMNDIDLSNYEWASISNSLRGVFDGNNYTISGIGAKTTYENTDLSLGLFSGIDAVITNLTLKVDYRITLNDSTTTARSVYISSLGATNNLIADNVNVELNVAFIANAKIGSLQVCGLGGGATYTKDVTVNMDVSITANGEIDGITIGGLYGDAGNIVNAEVTLTADIKLNGDSSECYINIGGLSGGCSGVNTISGATVDADVTITGTSVSSCNIGGLVGGGWYATINLENITSDLTLNISSDLADSPYVDCGKYVAEGSLGGGAIYVDEETCSGTVTINET